MKGFFKQVVRAWNFAKENKDALPVPDSIKEGIGAGEQIEQGVKGIVKTIKKPKDSAPAPR